MAVTVQAASAGRLPSISSTDAWEKRMAEGAAAFVRFKDGGSL